MSGYQKPSPQVPQQEPSLPRKLEANVSQIFKTVEIQIKGNACLIPDEGNYVSNFELKSVWFLFIAKKNNIFNTITSHFPFLFILYFLNSSQFAASS